MKNLIKKFTASAVLASVLFVPVIVNAESILDSISIQTQATKKIFVAGEDLDISGLVVFANYLGGEGDYSAAVPITESNISGFNSSALADPQTLTITYEGITSSYNISIVGPILDSISIHETSAQKLVYTVGEDLDISGLVVFANYLGGEGDYSAAVPITESNISGFDSSTSTPSQTLTISYKGETDSYDISVIAAPVIDEPVIDEPETTSGSSRRGGRSGGRIIPVAETGDLSGGEVLGESTFAFNMDLRYGMQNNDVRELQERLRAEGFFTFHTSTGYFGPITLAAVKAYQQAHFAEIGYVTGFCGPLTRAVLNK